MILNQIITKQPIKLIEANTDNKAVILINITNISNTDKTFNLYVVQSGKSVPIYDTNGNLISGNQETYFLIQKPITSKNSILLNLEKLLLGQGDSIYANCIEDDTSLVATISYEVY